MIRLPKFKLVGKPLRTRAAGVYQQRFRIEGQSKTSKVSLETKDVRVAQRRAAQYVEQRVEKLLVADDAQLKIQRSPLLDLLGTYEKAQRAEGTSEKWIGQSLGRIERIIRGCRFETVADITELDIKRWVADQRAVGAFGHQTSCHYLVSFKAFGSFLERTFNIDHPLRHMRCKPQGDVELTFRRRPFDDKEFAQLLKNAEGGKKKYGLSGHQRSLIYQIASETGYRAAEISSITVDACHFADDDPAIEVQRRVSKRRRYDRIPVPASLAAKLQKYIADSGLSDGDPLFPATSWSCHASAMIQTDMALIDRELPSGVLHFHSLRNRNVTNTIAAKAGVVDSLLLCRLSHPRLLLTYNRSSPARLRDIVERRSR